jgi:hypothetical protein
VSPAGFGHHRAGTLDPAAFGSYCAGVRALMTRPGFRAPWKISALAPLSPTVETYALLPTSKAFWNITKASAANPS